MAAPSTTDVPADVSPEQGVTEVAANHSGSSDEIDRTLQADTSSATALDLDVAPILGSLSSATLDHEVNNASAVPVPLDAEPGSPSFASRLLAASSFAGSELERFWRLAKAPYNVVRQHHVEEAGVLWEIVADRRPTNTLVIGRTLGRGVVELGFRGTVLADSTGQKQLCKYLYRPGHSGCAPQRSACDWLRRRRGSGAQGVPGCLPDGAGRCLAVA